MALGIFKVRGMVAAIAAVTGLASSSAFALGLGDVSLQSSLYEPLDAEIQLQDQQGLQPDDMRVGLASAEDFAKSGVDRPVFLNNLVFTVVMRPGNRSVLHVTSREPVREPYLDFIVQVASSGGRVMHEYTLLLDPAPAGRPRVAGVAPRLPVTQVANSAVRPTATAPAATVSTAARAQDHYTTQVNDSLYAIAARYRAGGSVAQNMLAIQQLNPNAFVGDNINGLKRNQSLQLPDAKQAATRTRSAAEQQVVAQNEAWKHPGDVAAAKPAEQLDATAHTADSTAAPSAVKGHDNLSLVAASHGKGQGKKGDSQAVRDQLAVAQEGLDTAQRENEELHSRMADLQSQLDKLQRLVELKNNELARMQAALAKPEVTSACTPAIPAVTNPDGTVTPATPAACPPTLASNTVTPPSAMPAPATPAQAPAVQ